MENFRIPGSREGRVYVVRIMKESSFDGAWQNILNNLLKYKFTFSAADGV